jgi:outer membrane protein assembly factor BamA
MTSFLTWLVWGAIAAAPQPQTPANAAEVIAEIRIHGNVATPDEEVLKIAGVSKGDPFREAMIKEVRDRLKASGKFQTIQVLKRYASIEDATQIALVILVNEGPVEIKMPDQAGEIPRILRRGGFKNFMFMPIFDLEDGYGITFGARVAFVGVARGHNRLSSPLTWGGLKRAGLEYERTFDRGPLSRVEVGGVIQQRTNPAYEEHDDRKRVWARAERVAGPIRAGATVGFQDVSFADLDDRLKTFGADIAFDTRLDPVLPRNAVFASASWERVTGATPEGLDRIKLDGRGYLGLPGQTVLVARALREDASDPQPLYLRSMLGGWSNLRGFKAGSFTGDTLVSGSLELRVPLNSPLQIARLGVNLFVDTGTTYEKGARFKDSPLYTGYGAGGWLTITALKLGVAVAHGKGAGTRVTFAGGLTF